MEGDQVTIAWDGVPWAGSAAEILFGGVKADRGGSETAGTLRVDAAPHATGKVDVLMDFGSGRTFTVGTFVYE